MLPENLTIPAITASCITVSGDLTAQDIAVMLIVLWQSGQGRRDGVGIDIPEKTLRQDLFGAKRAHDLKRDGERFDRLAKASLAFDERLPDIENGVPAPVVEEGMRRVLVEGHQRWTVDTGLQAAFRPREGDDTIELPLGLLQRARCRFSALLYMRMASWIEGELDRKWIRRATETKLLLRVPLQSIREAVGFDGDTAQLEKYCLEPAIREINTLTDWHLNAVMVRAPSRGLGKVMFVDLLIGKPVLVTPKARVRKSRLVLEALPANVVRLQPPRRITRGTIPKTDEQLEF